VVNPAVQDLGKQPYLPTLLSDPSTDSQEKQDIAEQSPIKMGLTYCTIQSPLFQSVYLPPLPTPLSALCLCPRPTSLRAELALSPRSRPWHFGRVGLLVNGDVGSRGGWMCVLGKQGFVGCDCLIPGGLFFHSSSLLIPHHGRVVRAEASLGSGTRLAPLLPLASRTACALSSLRQRERERALSEKQTVLEDVSNFVFCSQSHFK